MRVLIGSCNLVYPWIFTVLGTERKMARCFTTVSEEEIEEAFFYPSDLVSTETTIPLRVGYSSGYIQYLDASHLGIYPPLFTSSSRDSCILFTSTYLKFPRPNNDGPNMTWQTSWAYSWHFFYFFSDSVME